MKKFMTDIRTLAALLMAGAAFTACSSDDNTIDEQPVNPAKHTYTFTVKASKGGGDATTRALILTGEGNKTLNAYWDGSETVTVKEGDTPLGTLTVTPDATDDTQATLSGELNSAPSGTSLTLELFSNAYNSQDGTLAYIASHCDYATATTTVAYDAVNKTITGTDADFTNQQAIIKFALKDKANDAVIIPTALTVTDGTSTVSLTDIPADTYTTNGDGVLYVAFPAAGSAKTITLTATVGSDTYTYTTSSAKTFTNGQYYEIGVKMSPIISLSGRTILDDELVIADGYIVTGSAYAFSCKVAVADGATVTLRDVENDNGSLDPSSACPGIRCIGDATIILEGNNTVKGSGMYAGIYVPENKTLTIRGTGSLTVTGGSRGAGIGGNIEGNCGSIVISGGTVEATGGQYGAGIGLGYSYEKEFGDITISGGTVTATGCDGAPGIGGPNAFFKNITITDGVTKVTVNKGSSSTYSIGTSESEYMEYCGAITIGGTVYHNDEGYFENDGESKLQTITFVYQP